MTELHRIAGTFSRDPDTGTFAPIGQRRADALTELATKGLADDGDSDRATVTVFFDWDRWQAELASGIQLSDETLRRLCCDARFEAVGRSNGEVVAAATVRTDVPFWLRHAAKRRDHGCRFHGCGHVRRTEAHHVIASEHGGPTKLGNLLTLCSFHHHLVHEGGWKVVGSPDGPIVFEKPGENRRVDGRPPPLHHDIATVLEQTLGRHTVNLN